MFYSCLINHTNVNWFVTWHTYFLRRFGKVFAIACANATLVHPRDIHYTYTHTSSAITQASTLNDGREYKNKIEIVLLLLLLCLAAFQRLSPLPPFKWFVYLKFEHEWHRTNIVHRSMVVVFSAICNVSTEWQSLIRPCKLAMITTTAITGSAFFFMQ